MTADGGISGYQQYTTMMNCLNACKAFPMGAASDTSGNSLGCRQYHANLAKMDPATHCPHAGPGGAGTCGSNCDGYCQIATMYCTDSNMAKVYSSVSDCTMTCGQFPDNVPYSIAVQDGKSTACLLYHSQEASSAPADHCLGDLAKGDGGVLSVTCM
jgi:hypothetical protein